MRRLLTVRHTLGKNAETIMADKPKKRKPKDTGKLKSSLPKLKFKPGSVSFFQMVDGKPVPMGEAPTLPPAIEKTLEALLGGDDGYEGSAKFSYAEAKTVQEATDYFSDLYKLPEAEDPIEKAIKAGAVKLFGPDFNGNLSVEKCKAGGHDKLMISLTSLTPGPCQCENCKAAWANRGVEECNLKFQAEMLLSTSGNRIVIPTGEEWLGINLLERDDELPPRKEAPKRAKATRKKNSVPKTR